MKSKKTNPKANPVHKTPPLVSQIDATESALRNQKTIEKPSDSKCTTILHSSAQSDRGRHAAHCRICKHAQREDIEADFIAWESPTQIVKIYGLANRASVYRHAHAVHLFPKRRRNLRAAAERIIEQGANVEPSASAVVAAIQLCARINARGEWIEREETLNLDELFERMSPDELKAYAENGTLPQWFQEVIGEAGRRNGKDNGHE